MLLGPLKLPGLPSSSTFIYIYIAFCTYFIHKILRDIYLKGFRNGKYIFFKKKLKKLKQVSLKFCV
jgi:hypothetical protein